MLRRAALFGLLGICLTTFGSPRVAWSFATASAAEEKGEGPRRELLYKLINFAILVGVLGYVLRKPVAQFFSSRSAAIQKSLEESRKALETSQGQLQAVEERLRHLGEEIAAFKASAATEMEAERQRLREVAEQDAERILEATRAQLETDLRAAKVQLKSLAAQHSVELAERLIRERLDEPTRQRLVSQFTATLHAKEKPN